MSAPCRKLFSSHIFNMKSIKLYVYSKPLKYIYASCISIWNVKAGKDVYEHLKVSDVAMSNKY